MSCIPGELGLLGQVLKRHRHRDGLGGYGPFVVHAELDDRGVVANVMDNAPVPHLELRQARALHGRPGTGCPVGDQVPAWPSPV